MKKGLLLGSALFAVPFVAGAQTITEGTVTGIFTSIQNIVNAALPVIISIAVLLFLWGLVKYLLNADDAEARASSRSLMIWGVVIIFVMISVWGLVNFLGDIFELDNTVGAVPGTPS